MTFLRHALVLAALLCTLPAHAQPSDSEAATIAHKVASQTQWLASTKVCPAQVFPSRLHQDKQARERCRPGNLDQCLSSCSANNASACYWLGQELMAVKVDSALSEALFHRSCQLGVVSGCTNRAAGMLEEKPNDPATQQCAIQTFSKGCDADDPWACTMYAMHVGLGRGVARDTGKALKALEKSCKYGPTDAACTAGMRLKSVLQNPAAQAPQK